MGQIKLGRVQGKSIKRIDKVDTDGLTDTYEAVLDDSTSAGQFTVKNGRDGIGAGLYAESKEFASPVPTRSKTRRHSWSIRGKTQKACWISFLNGL